MKFKFGDKVRIIKEGLLISKNKIGKEGIIKVVIDKKQKNGIYLDEHEQYTVVFENGNWLPCWEDEIELI